MVTTYYVISSRLSSHFWVKMHVLSTFFNNKSETCQWNDAKDLFKCYFISEAQKITIYRDFNLISNSWWNPRWRPLLVTSIKNKITTYLLRQVTRREKGQSSILLLSQFRGSKEIIVNSVKFFLHENCLPFLKLKLITVAVANLKTFFWCY